MPDWPTGPGGWALSESSNCLLGRILHRQTVNHARASLVRGSYPQSKHAAGATLRLSFYLPLTKKTSAYGTRKLTSLLPAFPGYMFILASEEDRICALHTNRVIRVLDVHEKCILHYDLYQPEQLISPGAALTAESRLTAGQEVRIRRVSSYPSKIVPGRLAQP